MCGIYPLLVAVQMLVLTGPDNQLVEVAANHVVELRYPRSSEHFAHGTRCIVFTSDGKYVAVTETCKQINDMLK